MVRPASAILYGLCATLATPCFAATTDRALDLPSALNEIARRSGIELVFDPAQVAGFKVRLPQVTSPAAALTQLLAPTGFTFRQVDARAFIIVKRTARKPAPVSLPEPPPSAGPEIMVNGLRSQNVDLTRGPDEIQPYTIATSADILASGEPTLGDFLNSRLALDRSGSALSQGLNSPRSQVDVHGVGALQTLVLVDGRRLASIPLSVGVDAQSDLNAIPPEAVERIEVLATSAGGIFGIGATGGAINVVLKRDYNGLFLSADGGLSDRGDGVEHRLYGRLGWTSRDGRTRIMVSGSWMHDDGLLQQDRPYLEQARTLRVSYVGYVDTYASNSLNIRSVTGAALTFTPAYGGGSLGSSVTSMPLGTGALGSAGLAALTANAGRQDLSLASDGQGDLGQLVARTTRIAVMGNIRQEIGESSQLFLDYLRLDDKGFGNIPQIANANASLAAGAGGNPFNQAITVTFPTDLGYGVFEERNTQQRATLGFLRRFAGGWSLEADAGYAVTSLTQGYGSGAIATEPDVFDGVAALDAGLASYAAVHFTTQSTNRLGEGNLRLSGPLIRLPGGMATFSTSAAYRYEWSRGFWLDVDETYLGETFDTNLTRYAERQNTWSAMGETRLPILPESGKAALWRGLAAQLALRLDRYSLRSPGGYSQQNYISRGSVLAATFGLQSHPVSGLMLRASVSTAATPPTLEQLASLTFVSVSIAGDNDPERGGVIPASASKVQLLDGNPNLRPQSTVTLSGGMVIEPEALPGFRASIDYTALATHHEVVQLPPGTQYLLDHEATFPDLITRAPLTAADRAAGYTGGQILSIIEGDAQTGHSLLQTLDIALGYDTAAGSGHLALRADVDWEMSFRRLANPLEGSFDLVGHSDGPLAWRSNLSAMWSNPRWSVGAQAQLYAGYSLGQATPADQYESTIPLSTMLAVSAREPHVPMQDYIDLSFAFRPLGRKGLQVRLTIDNIFNKKPPIVANALPAALEGDIDVTPTSGVASYGDVLGRRFALNLSLPLHR